jgi:hypothetical protein
MTTARQPPTLIPPPAWARARLREQVSGRPSRWLRRTVPGPPLALSAKGVGLHEVVVESAGHNRYLANMDDDESTTWFGRIAIACARCAPSITSGRSSSQEPRLSAGTSVDHPHSQIVGMPVVPGHRRHQYDVAVRTTMSEAATSTGDGGIRIGARTPRGA